MTATPADVIEATRRLAAILKMALPAAGYSASFESKIQLLAEQLQRRGVQPPLTHEPIGRGHSNGVVEVEDGPGLLSPGWHRELAEQLVHADKARPKEIDGEGRHLCSPT